MRRRTSLLLAFAVLTSAATMPLHAAGESVGSKLDRARHARADAVATLRKAERRYAELRRQYGATQLELEDVATQVLVAYQGQLEAKQQFEAAQRTLDQAAVEAYQAGPGLSLAAVLGTTTMADLAAAQEFAAKAFQVGAEAVQRVENLRVSLQFATEQLSKRELALGMTSLRLRRLTSQMRDQVARARAAARVAGLLVKRLELQQQAIERAQAAANEQLANLVRSERYASLMQRLALLGPNQGRGCAIPSTLRDTGQRMAGLASWYGDDTITATGDPFDPNLFTAANKELPLNVYIRVHYNGKCAILLVNDRGPYGYGRVFDLSEGAATYLGYWSAGVVWVTADVLVPSN